MSPKRAVETMQRPAECNQTVGAHETTKPARSTKTTRARRSLQPLTNPPEPVQQPLAASKNTLVPLQTTGRKRKRGVEDECLGKRGRKEPRTEVESVQELSKTNLEEFTRQIEMEKSMGSGKRSLSRRTSTADISQDAASVSSQKSSTYANYRWTYLDFARIYVENGPIPENIQKRVDAILQPKLSEQRQNELSVISDTFCNDFVDVMKAASREDDSVEPIHSALRSLDSGKKFIFPRKADWDTTLKPSVQLSFWHFNVSEPNVAADDSHNRPNKRQQAESSYISPESSESTLPPFCVPGDSSGLPVPPPAVPPKRNTSIVKTPRPDITVGLRDITVIERLKAQGLRDLQASDFLRILQFQQELCSNPLQPAYPMRFPPLVVEGKSYSTGRPVFEAQNQAAVSGSCMTNLQHKLAELTERVSPGSRQSPWGEPLAFSICTEGPMMQLWVHYTTSVDGERMYNMNILKICHASAQPSLREGVKDFFKAVHGVMSWATSELLDEIVEQLGLVWNAGKQHAA